jgi:hypothetical protein
MGAWSGIAVAIFSVAFSVTAILGFADVLDFPWDPVLPDGASLLMAIAFVVMMVSLHHTRRRLDRGASSGSSSPPCTPSWPASSTS